MNNKKGLSDLVNTVLLVVLTIVVIGVVSIFVFDLLKRDSFELSSINFNFGKIEAHYNNEPVPSQVINANEFKETVYVSVERGVDNINLTGFKFIFSVGGNSYSCIRKNVPNNLETTTYAFKSSIFNQKPEKVEVIPIVRFESKEKTARSGFLIKLVYDTNKDFGEKFDECGGFCCGANLNLPSNPSLP